MRVLSVPCALALGGCSFCWREVEAPCREPFTTTVVRVIDGDTLEVSPPVELPDGSSLDTVRLLCVDTPEVSGIPECYGDEAREWLADRLQEREVELFFAEDCTDIYGRVLAYVGQGRDLVNIELAELGYALPIDEWFGDYPCCAEVNAAVEEAKAEERGGWGECAGSPWSG